MSKVAPYFLVDPREAADKFGPRTKATLSGLLEQEKAEGKPNVQSADDALKEYLAGLYVADRTGMDPIEIHQNWETHATKYFGEPTSKLEAYDQGRKFYRQVFGPKHNDFIDAGKLFAEGTTDPFMRAAQGGLHAAAVQADRMLTPGQREISPYTPTVTRSIPGVSSELQEKLREHMTGLQKEMQFEEDLFETYLEQPEPQPYLVDNILMDASKYIGEQRENLQQWLDVDEDFRASLAGQVSQGLGQLIGYIGMNSIPYIGTAAMGTSMYQEAVDDYYASGGTDDREAMRIGTVYGVSSMWLEKAGINTVIGKMWKGADANGRLAWSTIARRASERGAKGFIAEGTTEASQGALLDFIASQTYDGDRTMITQDAFKRRLMEFTVGGIVGKIGAGSVSTLQDVKMNRLEGRYLRTPTETGTFTRSEFKDARKKYTDQQIQRILPEKQADMFIRALDGDETAQVAYNDMVNPLVTDIEGLDVVEERGRNILYKTKNAYYWRRKHEDGQTEIHKIDTKTPTGARFISQIQNKDVFESEKRMSEWDAERFHKALFGMTGVPEVADNGDGYTVITPEGEDLGDFDTKDEAYDAAFKEMMKRMYSQRSEELSEAINSISQLLKGEVKIENLTDRERTLLDLYNEDPGSLEALQDAVRTVQNLDKEAPVSPQELADFILAGQSVKVHGVYTNRIFRDGEVDTVLKEISESYIKRALDVGAATEQELMEWYRDWIDFTGKKKYAFTVQGAIENFSDMAASHVFTDGGMTRDIAESSTMRRLLTTFFDTWVRKLRTYLGKLAQHAKSYFDMKQAGLIDATLEEHLNNVLNPDAYRDLEDMNEALVGPQTFEIASRPKAGTEYVPRSVKQKVYNQIQPKEGHEADLRKMLKRKPEVGIPQANERVVVEADGMKVYLGKGKTFDDWIDQVESILSDREIEEARNWYHDSSQAFQDYFGGDWWLYYTAWLAAQQSESPVGGLRNALLAAEETYAMVAYRDLNKKGEPKKAGLADSRLRELFGGEAMTDLEKKLYDFLDSGMGSQTRRFYDNNPDAMKPAVIDRHTWRDRGFVDKAFVEHMKKAGIDVSGIGIDNKNPSPSDTQYDQTLIWMNQLSDYLDEQEWKGGDWEPFQVQAVGWIALAKFVKKGGTVHESIAASERTIMAEMDFGEGAPWNEDVDLTGLTEQEHRVLSSEAVGKALDVAKEITGAPTDAIRTFAHGGWMDYPQAFSGTAKFLATEGTMKDVQSILGYLLQQTEVYGITDNTQAIDVSVYVKSDAFNNPAVADRVYRALREKAPDLIYGYSSDTVEGTPAMVMGVETPKATFKSGPRKGTQKSGADYSAKERTAMVASRIQEIEDTITPILREFEDEIEFDLEFAKSEITSVANDWTKNPDGKSYLQRLNSRYRPEILSRLTDSYGPQLKSFIQERARSLQESRPNRRGRGAKSPTSTFELVTARHWSRQANLETLDPAFHGTGIQGAESARKKAYKDQYQDRVYFGLEGYTKEPGLPSNLYELQIDDDLLYDFKADPEGLYEEAIAEARRLYPYAPFDNKAKATIYERLIKEAGYLGYYSGNVGVSYYPIPTKQPANQDWRKRQTFELEQGKVRDAIGNEPPENAGTDEIDELFGAYHEQIKRELADRQRQEEERALAENRIPLTKDRGTISYLGLPISSAIRRYSPRMFAKVREHTMTLNTQVQDYTMRTMDFRKALHKLPKPQRLAVGLALSNQDHESARKLLKNNKAYKEMMKVIDEIGTRAQMAGFEFDFMRDYFPRLVTDYDGLMESFGAEVDGPLRAAIAKREMDSGPLSEEERIMIINRFLAGTLKGSDAPGNTKARTIHQLTPEQYEKFYADPYDALDSYINRMVGAIMTREFFGRKTVWQDIDFEIDYGDLKDMLEDEVNLADLNVGDGTVTATRSKKVRIDVEKSAGAVAKLEELTPAEQKDLQANLAALFNYRATPKAWNNFRMLGYLTTMGHGFTSTITQFQDMAFARHEGGTGRTLTSWLAAVFNISEVKIQRDLGMGDYSQEYKDMISASKIVDKVFTWNGLKHFGRAGQNALVNAGIRKYRAEAKRGTFSARHRERLNEYFANDQDRIAQLKEDLRKGNMTFDVHLLGWNILMDYHPASLTEMPRGYLENPRARVAYMLKTFTIKQFDSYRREGFSEMRRGFRERDWKRTARGAKMLTALAATLWLLGMPVDWIKDLLMGRDPSWSDVAVDNVWKLVGLSRYNLYYARQHGLRDTALIALAPPFPVLDYGFRDVTTGLDPDKEFEWRTAESWRNVPLIGSPIYWWFGGGHDKIERKKQREARKKGSDL